jgi:hypothetical protein
MLSDPVTQAVMDADRVDLRELIAMLSEIGHAIKCPRGATAGLDRAQRQAQPLRNL